MSQCHNEVLAQTESSNTTRIDLSRDGVFCRISVAGQEKQVSILHWEFKSSNTPSVPNLKSKKTTCLELPYQVL